MRKNIKLYIADKEVDCSGDISLPITYTVEDFNNPTIVKNSFSKTISIPGTANNNKIFGEIYKLDRIQHYKDGVYNGIYFNPSKRVDFQIYNNGYLLETGYMQLNTISIKMAVITYNITLYGGLGDFFYNLKYKEDGTTKTLADINYGIGSDPTTELDFKINKDTVYNAFNSVGSGGGIYELVTFIPSYNGVYENFSNDVCLINTNGTSLFPTSATDSGNTYTPYNGYGLAKLEGSYNEWEIRDLRSYMQRPALKVSKLIESICSKENSGYDVIFDDEFFNYKNPYWNDTYIALPLLGSNESEEDSVTENVKADLGEVWIGKKPSQNTVEYGWFPFNFTGSSMITTNTSTNYTDFSKTPSNALMDIDLDIQLFFNPNQSTTANDLYINYVLNGKSGNTEYKNHPQRSAITAQIAVFDYDVQYSALYASPIYVFTNDLPGDGALGPTSWATRDALCGMPGETILGHFVKDGSRYYFRSDQGNNTFRISLKDLPRRNKYIVMLQVMRKTQMATSKAHLYTSYNMHPDRVTENMVEGWEQVLYDKDRYVLFAEWPTAVASDVTITKDMLLKTEKSPADYLLSFTKLFGLYFVKDIDSKTIRIYTRNNFFKNEIVD